MEYFVIIISSIFVNNIVLSQFLGICPFLGVSGKVSTSLGMGAAVTFVLAIASIAAYLIQYHILVPLHIEYMQTIVFILVIAALVQMVEIMLKKVSPALYQALGIFLPLITTNCAVLGVAILLVQKRVQLGRSGGICRSRSGRIHVGAGPLCRPAGTVGTGECSKSIAGCPHRIDYSRHSGDGFYGIFRVGALTRRSKKESVTIHNMEITGGAAKSRPVLYRFSPILR